MRMCQRHMATTAVVEFVHAAPQTLERLKGTAKDTAEEGNDTQNKQLVLRRQAYSLLQRAALNPGGTA